MMIHHGRVGSTVLARSLVHPQLHIAGEIFTRNVAIKPNWREEMNLYEYFDFNVNIAEKENSKTLKNRSTLVNEKIYFFEYKPSFCQPAPRLFLKGFQEKGVEKFIFLYRENLIRRYVSFLISKKTGVWHQFSDKPELIQVRISFDACSDPEIGMIHCDLIMLLEYYYDYLLPHYKQCLSQYGDQVLCLSYEKDIEQDVRVANSKVIEFLGVDKSVFVGNPKVKRQNPFSLSEIIINYDELKNRLSDTKFNYLLDE